MKVVVDSSVFIDYVRARKGLLPQLTDLVRRKKLILYIPTVVILELWTGLSMSEKGNERKMKRLLRPTKAFPLTRQLAEKSGQLLRDKVIEEFADSVVTATALHLDAQLATGNKRHFEKAKDLKFFKLQKS